MIKVHSLRSMMRNCAFANKCWLTVAFRALPAGVVTVGIYDSEDMVPSLMSGSNRATATNTSFPYSDPAWACQGNPETVFASDMIVGWSRTDENPMGRI